MINAISDGVKSSNARHAGFTSFARRLPRGLVEDENPALDGGEAEPATDGGVALLVGVLESGETTAEERAQRIGPVGPVDGLAARTLRHGGH
jgi:hypothetical protein